MLALVTCHISPPSIWYGKKWIQEKMNSWHLTSRLTARSFSEPTASRVRSGRCPRQCATLLHGQMYSIFRKKRLFCNLATRWNLSHHFLSMDGWPGDAIFFLWGQPLKIIHKYSVKKGPAPWILFLTRAPRPLEVTFFGWWSWTYVVVPLLQGQMHFRKKKTPVLQFGRVDTKFLNSSHHVLSVDDWPGDATFFLWANLWRLSASIQSKKGPAPWILFLTPAPRPLQVTFLVGEAEHVCLYPFAGTNVFSEKKRLFCNLGALTQNSWIRPIMSYLWMIGLEMRLFSCGPTFEDYPLVFSQKKVQPLGFYFWHLRLGLFKSLFWLVKLNMCVCTLLQGQLYFQQKNMCFAIWARVDTKFLNSSHHVLSVDDWPGDATFFPVGPTFEDHPKYSVKKGPAPWILFLTRAPRPLEVTFFCWWRWTYVVVPFCKVM